MNAAPPFSSRTLCFFLAIDLIAAPIVLRGARAGAQDAPPAAAGDDAAARKDRLLRAERLYAALEEWQRARPRDGFDVRGIIDAAGRDPLHILEWVRSRTRWVPYKGSLRGGPGVLIDRTGNSLDRALLLAEALRAGGHKARLARVRLEEAQARAVLERLQAAGGGKDAAAAGPAAESAPLLERYPETQRLMEEMRLDAERSAEAAARQAEDNLALLSAALASRNAGAAPAAPAPGAPGPDAAACLQDHWWVQVQAGDAWTDLDLLAGELPEGALRGKQPEFLTLEEASVRISGDEALAHDLEVRIIVERWDRGTLQEEPALRHRLRPADAFGKRIQLRFLPLHWPKDMRPFDPDAERGLKKLKAAAAAEVEWLPSLRAGEEEISQSSFTASGEVHQSPSLEPLAGALGKGVANLGRNFGGALAGDGGSAPGEAATALSGVWLEYEIRSPGQPPRKARRVVFDALDGAARAAAAGAVRKPGGGEPERLQRGLALLCETEMLPMASRISPAYIDHLLTAGLLANRGFFLGMLRQDAGGPAAAAPARGAGRISPMPGELLNLAAARFAWSRSGGAVFLAEQNLFTTHTRLSANPQGELVLAHGFDIVFNPVEMLPGAAGDPFRARLEQGVADTTAEAVLTPDMGEAIHPAILFARARAEGIGSVAIAGVDDPRWKELKLPANVRGRIEEDLKAGFIAIVPERAPTVAGRTMLGWWRVHSRTGETLGRMESGEGQSMTERIIQQAILMLPGALSSAAAWHCKKIGKSDGLCNPCLIAMVGLFGFFISFAAGTAAWTIGEKSALMYAGGVGLGLFGAISKSGACVESVMKKYGG